METSTRISSNVFDLIMDSKEGLISTEGFQHCVMRLVNAEGQF